MWQAPSKTISCMHAVKQARRTCQLSPVNESLSECTFVLNDRPVKKLSQKFNLQQDFITATISNGKDRWAEEFRRVLELSDVRFTIENIRRPKGCKLSMIEVSWNG